MQLRWGVCRPQKPGRGRQAENAVEHRSRRFDVAVGQQSRQLGEVRTEVDARIRSERFGFRREDEASVVGQGPIQRLFTNPVPHQQQAVAARVVYGEREHTVQGVETLGTERQVLFEDHFGVRGGPKRRAPRGETGAQVLEIIDLAVEDEVHPAASRHERLGRPLGEVDDLEASVGEDTSVVRKYGHPVGVGPSMREGSNQRVADPVPFSAS